MLTLEHTTALLVIYKQLERLDSCNKPQAQFLFRSILEASLNKSTSRIIGTCNFWYEAYES